MQNAPATGSMTPSQGAGPQQGQGPQVNASQAAAQGAGQPSASAGAGGGGGRVSGGRFDFDDGGTYCGGWEDGKAHGHGVCTGPKGQGAYSGSWHYGFEVSGVYTWPSGSTFEGQWQNGKRHGLGLESRGRWLYRGEWTQGFKGRYGVRQSATSNARYEGTWANGLQDGYGSETYADGGTYQGQWLRGMRHGYGVRASAPFGLASHYRPSKTQLRASLTSLRSAEGGGGGGGGGGGSAEAGAAPSDLRDRRVDDARGGFVLKARSDDAPTARRRSLVEKSTNLKKSLFSGLKIRRQRSTGDLEKRGTSASIRSAGSSASWVSTDSAHSAMTSASVHTDSNASFVVEDEQMDASVTETYMGEWKNDRRSGFGISERSDGLRYEGEWFNNKKYGYGATTFKDGSKEEGKYKNNVLITSQKKKHLFLIRSAKFRERIDSAVNAAQRASKIALQKADIAISRTATARGKAELADVAAAHAHEDSEIARRTAKTFAPDFQQPAGLDRIRPKYRYHSDAATQQQQTASPTSQASSGSPMQQTPSSMPSSPAVSQPQGYNTSAAARTSLENDASMQNKMGPPASQYQQPQQYQQSQQYQQQQQQYQQQQQQQQYQQQQYQQQLASQQQQQMMAAAQQQQAQAANQPSAYMNHNQQPAMAMSPQQTASVAQPMRPPQQQNYQNADMLNGGGVVGATKDDTSMVDGLQEKSGAAAQRSSSNLTRGSRARPDAEPPGYSFQQAMSDHFDHYKRPPSRDSSVDRYTRAASRLASRTPSVDNPGAIAAAAAAALGGVGGIGVGTQATRMARNTTPTPAEAAGTGPRRSLLGTAAEGVKAGAAAAAAGNGAVMMGVAAATSPLLFGAAGPGQGAAAPAPLPPGYPQFEEVLLRKRGLGQDILPSLRQPNRTESLYIGQPVSPRPTTVKASVLTSPSPLPPAGAMSRKKSLPDVQALPRATEPMSREEVSALGSLRREEIRRMAEESERLRANPLLYLVSPGVKDWFSRQKLVMLVLFINISLAIMFFKLLT